MRRFCFAQALRVARTPDAADEAAQEAIIRAWRHRERCHRPEEPFGWLRRIAHNEAVRVVGRRGREVLTPEPLLDQTRSGEDDGLEDRLLLSDALAALSESDRELARLRYWEDLTCGTVAERLGTSEAAVKVRLHRLRRRLRQGLEERS